MNKLTAIKAAVLGVAVLGLAACGDDDDPVVTTAEYMLTVHNNTAAQPFSPVLAALHNDSAMLWQLGQPASVALEVMAEGGDNSQLMTALADQYAVASTEMVLMPGNSDELSLQAELKSGLLLSVATMLVNTNDAFTGVMQIDVSGLEVGESMQLNLPIYDAGTEFNSEAVGSIPGPADGGEGYNAARDDVADAVSRHPGVVSQADDADSVLLPQHRINNRAGSVVVTRIN